MSIEEFRQLTQQQIAEYPLALQALWYDYRDDWHQSHKKIDYESDRETAAYADRSCAWVHAYLHRKEGDLSNARYWYRRSGRPESKLSLTQERQEIASALLREI